MPIRVLLLLFTLTAGASAVPILEYRGALHGDPPLTRPAAIAIDAESLQLCITDEARRSLEVFDARGFHRFRTNAASGIRSPSGGAIDAQGDFLFLDAVVGEPRARVIRRLNFLGEPVDFAPESPRESWSPRHLLLARNGDAVTVDASGLMARHDPDGQLRWTLQVAEAEWEGVELLGAPTEAPDGTILVPGAALGRVIRVSADGQKRGAFGVPGTKRGELAFPVGATVGPEGHVLVLDRMRHLVLVYDENYTFVNEFGRLGFRPGEFYYPLAIAAAPDGRVFVSQGYLGRVQVFRLFDTATVTTPEPVGR